jgi:hypothetical protein
MITRIGREVDRSDIDTQITEYIQTAISMLYNLKEWSILEQVYSITTTASTQEYALTSNYGEVLSVYYDSGSNYGHPLDIMTAARADGLFAGATNEGIPYYAWLAYENGILKIYFQPIPSSALTIKVRYKLGMPNVNLHDVTVADDDSAAATGVSLYFDEDAVDTGVGKFYFVSPTNADATIALQTADGHYHEFTVYDSDTAATLGVQVYFDDDGGTERNRLLFISPTGVDGAVATGVKNKHNHFIKLVDDDGAASTGTPVYVDEDAANKENRLLSVNANNANSTFEITLTKDDEAHVFPPTFDEVVRLTALAETQDFCKRYEAAKKTIAKAGMEQAKLMSRDDGQIGRAIRVIPRGQGMPAGEYWKDPFYKG